MVVDSVEVVLAGCCVKRSIRTYVLEFGKYS